MKELGEYLKEKRIENSVGVEEAAEDLNLTKDDIENIEEGNVRAFKDVLKLKELVREYAKYLGLDHEKVVDEFNDFLFEHTSKISLNDILEAQQKKEEEEKKIVSPYTKVSKKHLNWERLLQLKPLFILLIIVLLMILLIFLYLSMSNDDNEIKHDVELMNVRSEECEFA